MVSEHGDDKSNDSLPKWSMNVPLGDSGYTVTSSQGSRVWVARDVNPNSLPKWSKNVQLGDNWILVKKLHGSHVWFVRDLNSPPNQEPRVAVAKRMQNDNASSGPRNRFYKEVKELQALGETEGVVPLIDREPGEEPRWFVMEQAAPLIKHVKGESFHSLVGIFADLAATLHQLHGDKSVSHRDIKPPNLFWYQNRPAFGDFGIAGWKDRTEITQEINKLGPLNYLAPEALRPRHRGPWYAADVYSLMKTMWALAEYQYEYLLAKETGTPTPAQIFPPPPGEMNAMNEWAYSFRRFFGRDGRYLDPVLQDATSNDPARRPTAGDLRDEFRAWLRLTEGAEPKPSPHSKYGTLVNRVERFGQAKALFLDTLKREVKASFGDVTFDSTVSTEWHFDPELEAAGPVILAAHGRDATVDTDYDDDEPPPDDPWDGALVLELLPAQRGFRVIVGGVLEGTADRPMIDLLAEFHQIDSAGRWTLAKQWDKGPMNAGGAVVVEALRKTLREVSATARGAQSTPWTSSRVL